MKPTILFCLTVFFWLFSNQARGEEITFPQPHTLWKPGDIWKISVAAYPREKLKKPVKKPKEKPEGPKPAAQYHVNVAVVNVMKMGTDPCWRLFFVPGPNPPPFLGDNYYVWVDQKTGRARKVGRLRESSAAFLEDLGDILFIKGGPKGFPLEFFPLLEVGDIEKNGDFASLTLSQQGQHILLEANFDPVLGEEITIKQKWVAGEKWWREYEREVNGQKDLVAKILSPALATQPGKKKDTQSALSGKTQSLAEDYFPLRRDPKLQVLLTLDAANPKVEELLNLLRKETGLHIVLDGNLRGHQPSYGKITFRQAPAYSLMELMAKKDLENGQWVKEENGYRLTGKSLLVPPRSYLVYWIGGGIFLFCFAGLGGVFVYRRRKVGSG